MTACSFAPNIIFLWFNPSQQLGTTQLLAHSLPQWDGGREWEEKKWEKKREKMRKLPTCTFPDHLLMGWGRWAEKRLAVWALLSSKENITVLSTLLPAQIQTQPCNTTMKRNISTPAKTSTHLHKMQPHRDHFSAALAVYVLRVAASIKKVGSGWVFYFVWFGLFSGKGGEHWSSSLKIWENQRQLILQRSSFNLPFSAQQNHTQADYSLLRPYFRSNPVCQ